MVHSGAGLKLWNQASKDKSVDRDITVQIKPTNLENFSHVDVRGCLRLE